MSHRNFGRPLPRDLSVMGRVAAVNAAATTQTHRPARRPGRLPAFFMGIAIGIMGTLYVIWAAGPTGLSW